VNVLSFVLGYNRIKGTTRARVTVLDGHEIRRHRKQLTMKIVHEKSVSSSSSRQSMMNTRLCVTWIKKRTHVRACVREAVDFK